MYLQLQYRVIDRQRPTVFKLYREQTLYLPRVACSCDVLRRQTGKKPKISGATIISPIIPPSRPLSPPHGLCSLHSLFPTLWPPLRGPERLWSDANIDLFHRA